MATNCKASYTFLSGNLVWTGLGVLFLLGVCNMSLLYVNVVEVLNLS